MPSRNALHLQVDELPESELERASKLLHALVEAAEEEHPELCSLREAPEDDEPETEEERAGVEEALREIREGRPGLTTDELERELGLK